jgi:hypothetical protein
MAKIERETVQTKDVAVGDEIWFPNSRHAQEVTAIENDEEKQIATVHAAETQWQLPYEHEIQRKVKADGDE